MLEIAVPQTYVAVSGNSLFVTGDLNALASQLGTTPTVVVSAYMCVTLGFKLSLARRIFISRPSKSSQTASTLVDEGLDGRRGVATSPHSSMMDCLNIRTFTPDILSLLYIEFCNSSPCTSTARHGRALLRRLGASGPRFRAPRGRHQATGIRFRAPARFELCTDPRRASRSPDPAPSSERLTQYFIAVENDVLKMPPGPAYNWYCVAHGVLDVLTRAAHIRAAQAEAQAARVLRRTDVHARRRTRSHVDEEVPSNLTLKPVPPRVHGELATEAPDAPGTETPAVRTYQHAPPLEKRTSTPIATAGSLPESPPPPLPSLPIPPTPPSIAPAATPLLAPTPAHDVLPGRTEAIPDDAVPPRDDPPRAEPIMPEVDMPASPATEAQPAEQSPVITGIPDAPVVSA